jgi:hypothetical protein
MNITPEEQNALVQFFGTMHAQAKQTDQMIVGSSPFVKPVSPQIQRELELALRVPVQASQPQHYQPETQQPQVYHPVEVAQAMQELHAIEQQATEQHVVPIQHIEAKPVSVPTTLDLNIIDVLKEINLNLSRIADTIEKHNVNTKRIKATKSA